MLINCAAYRDGAKLADVPIEAISDYLKLPGCFVWVAMRDPSPEELDTMRQEFDLHELAIEDVRNGHQRPKIEEYGDVLFVVMHVLETEQDGSINVGEIGIFVGRNYVLSVRNRTRTSFLNVRTRCEQEPELLRHGAGFVLYALMDAVVDRYFPVAHQLEQELDEIEDRIFSRASSARADIQALYELKRKLTIVQHTVSPQQETTAKLFGGRVPQACATLQEYYRDVYDHLDRIRRNVEATRELANTTLQVNLAMISLDQSDITKNLAAYGALFAVPTMIAGVYGMNFDRMPELKWTFGYPMAIGLMVLLDIFLWWRFRKAGWL